MRPRTRLLRTAVAAIGLALAMSAVAACGVTEKSANDSGRPIADLRIMVPNSPGGGYDITARTAAKVMEDSDITSGTEVFNLEGAGGTVGPRADREREGQRRPDDADGARRRRGVVHQQVRVHARGRPPRSRS